VQVDEIDLEAMQSEKLARPAVEGRQAVKMLSAGAPIANTMVKIVDEHHRDLPDRAIGEVALRSDCMLTEYYHRP